MGLFSKILSWFNRNQAPQVEEWPELPQPLDELREQMAYYFSAANLETDAFMKNLIANGEDRFVKASEFLVFSRVQKLGVTKDDILRACNACPDLEVSYATESIRSKAPFVSDPRRYFRTIHVEGLDREETLDTLKQFFNASFGRVLKIEMRKIFKDNQKVFSGVANVELETEEQAKAAVERGILYNDKLLKVSLFSDFKLSMESRKKGQKKPARNNRGSSQRKNNQE